MRTLIVCLSASLLLLTPGCDKDKAADKAAATGKKGKAGAKAATGALKAAPNAYKPTRFLPANTLGVFEISDPGALFDAHIRPGLMAVPELAAGLGKAAEESTEIFGSNLAEFKNLTTALAIEPHARWGIALLSEVGMVWAMYVPLTSGEEFLKKAGALATKLDVPVKWVKEGEGHVAKVGRREAAVVRGNLLYVLVADKSKSPLHELASGIATTKDGAGLDSAAGFTADRKALGSDAGNMRGWLHMGPIVDVIIKRDQARNSARTYKPRKWRVEALARAKTGGQPRAIAEAEKSLADDKKWFDRRIVRRTAETKLLAATFGSIESLTGQGAFGATGIDGTMRVSLRKDSVLSKLVGKGSGVSVTVKGLTEEPAMLLHGTLNKAEMKRLLDLAFRAEGGSWEKAAEELKKELKIDLDSEIWAPLAGEAGFAMTIDLAQAFAGGQQGDQAMGGAITLKLTDAAKTSAVMTKLTTAGLLKKGEKEGTWSVPADEWRAVFIAINGDWLSLSTTADFAANMAGDGAKSFAHKMAPGPKKALWNAEAGAVFSLNQVVLGMTLAAFSMDGGWGTSSRPAGLDAEKSKKWDTLDAMAKTGRKLQSEAQMASARGYIEAARLFGTSVLEAKAGDGAWTLTGGHFIAEGKTITDAFTGAAKAVKAGEAKAALKRKEGDALMLKFRPLAKELGVRVHGMRSFDVEATVESSKGPATTAPPIAAPKKAAVPAPTKKATK